MEEHNEDSEFLPNSQGNDQNYEPKKIKGIPSFKKYDEVKSMLLDMHGFPWNYHSFQRKGINLGKKTLSLDLQFNQEL